MPKQTADSLGDRSTRTKTPPQKKAEAYRKDRVYQHEWGGRGPNPTLQQVTALAQRRYRHAIRQRLAFAQRHEAVLAEIDIEPVRREAVSTWSQPFTLGEWVARLRAARTVRKVGWNYFREPYDSAQHRARFVRFLTATTQGRTPYAQAVARSFARWLGWNRPVNEATQLHARWRSSPYDEPWRQAWLEAFFQDEPAWRERLWAWIRVVGADGDTAVTGARVTRSHDLHPTGDED